MSPNLENSAVVTGAPLPPQARSLREPGGEFQEGGPRGQSPLPPRQIDTGRRGPARAKGRGRRVLASQWRRREELPGHLQGRLQRVRVTSSLRAERRRGRSRRAGSLLVQDSCFLQRAVPKEAGGGFFTQSISLLSTEEDPFPYKNDNFVITVAEVNAAPA